MKTLEELESQLRLMRRGAADYRLDPDHDPKELLRQVSECASLWGAIECFKKGETPVLDSQAAWLAE
jgi:hypothetical protein